jgi:hypothetical protein
MRKQPSSVMQSASFRASFLLHFIADELRLLMSGLPTPQDAFDPDELPLTFILRRDSRRAKRAIRRQAEGQNLVSQPVKPD